MNYNNIYNSIIKNAQSQERIRSLSYFENHHITPKSLGGGDEKSNMVLLTPKEHYVCHHLLTKIYPGQSMFWAFFCMSNGLNSIKNESYQGTASAYAYAKKNAAKHHWTKTPEGKARLSSRVKGSKISESAKKRMANQTCPHCGTVGNGAAMKTWHFNNCEVIKKRHKTKDSTRINCSKAQQVGTYHTPKGDFPTSQQAANANNTSRKTVMRRSTISNQRDAKNPRTPREWWGKTWSELGWGFTPNTVQE